MYKVTHRRFNLLLIWLVIGGWAMSELINNREYRKQALKELLRELHQGKPVEEVKAKFDAITQDLEPGELSLIEQSLIDEGLPVQEIQRLCDVHAAVFKDALARGPQVDAPHGHPLHVFLLENRAIEQLKDEKIEPLLQELERSGAADEKGLVLKLAEYLGLLGDIDKHYSRKENLLFPYLEKYEITAPPKVMWGVDDEIRAALKGARALALEYQGEREQLVAKTRETLHKIQEMIFKEEKILLPMAKETLTEDEWYQIYRETGEFGYCLVEPEQDWRPERLNVSQEAAEQGDHIRFDTGVLTPKEIGLIFNHLPVDITFVDAKGVVKFFSAPKDRIFPRPRTIIGRNVENCHPPASVHIVQDVVTDLVLGKKEHEDFWIRMGDQYVLIRYFAVRDEAGKYVGTLEVTQDIKPLQEITGEKRIMD
jgi:DUF438 domain-containing protein